MMGSFHTGRIRGSQRLAGTRKAQPHPCGGSVPKLYINTQAANSNNTPQSVGSHLHLCEGHMLALGRVQLVFTAIEGVLGVDMWRQDGWKHSLHLQRFYFVQL